MDPLIDGEDFASISMSMQEISPVTDRLLTLKRVTGFTAGTFDGVTPSPTYRTIQAPGLVEQVTPQEVVHSGGLLTLGDLKLITTFDILEKLDNVYPYTDTTKPQQADELVYEGVAYHMVGKPYREFEGGGVVEARSYWRRT